MVLLFLVDEFCMNILLLVWTIQIELGPYYIQLNSILIWGILDLTRAYHFSLLVIFLSADLVKVPDLSSFLFITCQCGPVVSNADFGS